MTPYHDGAPAPGATSPADRQATFFSLSAALALSEAENRALLDVPAETVAAIRAGTASLAEADRQKLQRRLDYAIPILRRMLAAMSD